MSYDSSFLVAVPRYENRKQYDIDEKNLPFYGTDVWHAYEFSSMTKNGLPVTRLMKMEYDCGSEFIVESKSLKLYLNSFNMSRFGKTQQECLEECKKIIENDLSETLKTQVRINFIDNTTQKTAVFSKYKNILKITNANDIKIEQFKETPEVLETEETKSRTEYFLTFDSLRSNCRVTHQPDFGDAFIYYKSKQHIKEESLIKYLCSFRTEYHFHEECCEMIFKRLFDKLDTDDELLVSILYTRRGGIDICPSRWSKNNKEISDIFLLTDIKKYARNGIKQ
ncbi:MAG: hypothetical protein KHX03_10070 [Clostridium sp.]|nr:hypothetical protein [Clostridium sp.]